MFDNDGIRHAIDEDGHFTVIPMKDVVSFRSVNCSRYYVAKYFNNVHIGSLLRIKLKQ